MQRAEPFQCRSWQIPGIVLIDMAGEPGMYNVILRYDDGSSSNHQIVVVE